MNESRPTRTPSKRNVVDQADPRAEDHAVTEVRAAQLHVGDDIVMNDWALHVCRVDVDGTSVAFVVEEFPEVILHRAADAVLHVSTTNTRSSSGTGRVA
jgi:predicted acyl esterase